MNLADLLPLLPELFLLVATCLLLLADLWISDQRRGLTHFLALMALAATAALVMREGVLPPQRIEAFDGMFIRDGVGAVLKVFILGVTAAAFIYAKPYLKERDILKGEFYSLCLFAVLGMMILVSAGNMLTIYLGLELMALSTYALVALHRDSKVATEAALKYFVLGAVASGMLLYGMSMLYGATGSLDLSSIAAQAATPGEQRTLLLFGAVFIVAGIAFKFGAAPFHMWLPDVYHGAPTAITLFIGSAPKLAAFGMAYRLLDGGMGAMEADWRSMLAWLAVASLVVGNLFAIAQSNLKRMLAYSTISHVGFLFLGLAAANSPNAEGYASAMFYAISYALMAIAGFAAVVLLSRRGFEGDEISDFRGLARRSPWHAWMVLAIMASLAGVPPFLGFWAKLAVLRSAVAADMVWLALVGVVFAVIGAFYYLRVIKVMFFEEPTEQFAPVINQDAQLRALFSANALLLLVLGVFSGPLMSWCQRALGL